MTYALLSQNFGYCPDTVTMGTTWGKKMCYKSYLKQKIWGTLSKQKAGLDDVLTQR